PGEVEAVGQLIRGAEGERTPGVLEDSLEWIEDRVREAVGGGGDGPGHEQHRGGHGRQHQAPDRMDARSGRGRLLDGGQHQVPSPDLRARRRNVGIDSAETFRQPLQSLDFRRQLTALPCKARSREPSARCCSACTAPTLFPMIKATCAAVRSWKKRRIRTCCCSSVKSRMAVWRSSFDSCSTASSEGSADSSAGACSSETSETLPWRR